MLGMWLQTSDQRKMVALNARLSNGSKHLNVNDGSKCLNIALNAIKVATNAKS